MGKAPKPSGKPGRSLPISRTNTWGATKGVAYHEAGHAVVAHLLGKQIKRVWVDVFSNSPVTKDGKFALRGCVEYLDKMAHPIAFLFKGGWPLDEEDRLLVDLWNKLPSEERQDQTKPLTETMMMNAAGAIAERRFQHKRRTISMSGSQGDDVEVQRFALLLHGGSLLTASVRMAAAFVQAKRMLYENWQSVVEIAEALLERGTLSGEEIAEIVERNRSR